MAESYSSTSVHDDEISLRDIYLLIKQGFWIIVALSVLAAALGYFYARSRPPVYTATSTTRVTPSSIGVQNTNGISLSPRTNVAYQVYERLAFSTPVLQEVLEQSGLEAELMTLKSMLGLSELLGPDDMQPQYAQIVPLLVEHHVSSSDPELSAQLAQLWVDASLSAVQSSLSQSISPVTSVTAGNREQLRAQMDAAEEELRAFRTANNPSLLSKVFAGLNERVASQRLERNDLARQISVAEARQAMLLQQLESERNTVSSSSASSDSFLAGLTLEQARETLAQQLQTAEEALQQARDARDSFERMHDRTSLARQLETYQQEVADLPFELRTLRDSLAQLRSEGVKLQEQLAQALSTVTSAEPLSQAFLAGLTLDEARAYIDAQHALASSNAHQAEQALRSFEQRHNLTSLQANITHYQTQVDTIPNQLQANREQQAALHASARLLAEQLTEVRGRILSLDPLEAESLQGLSLAQAQTLSRDQLTQAERVYQEREAALLAFTQTHDMAFLAQEIASYEAQQAALLANQHERELKQRQAEPAAEQDPQALAALQPRLKALRERYEALKQQRARLQQSLELAQNSYQALHVRDARLQAASLDPRGATRLLSQASQGELETPSQALERALRDNRRSMQALEQTQQALTARLEEARQALEPLRQEFITLEAEYQRLQQAHQQAQASLQEVATWREKTARAALDPRSDRSLRDSTPEVLALQQALREVERDLNSQQQRKHQLETRLETAQTLLPELALRQDSLEAEYDSLGLEYDQALATRNTLRSRLEDFRYSSQDPRQGRVLRTNSPELLSLQAALRTVELELSGLRQSLTSLESQLHANETSLEQTQAEFAQVSEQQSRLEAQLNATRSAYNNLVELSPTISYLSDLASVSAQVLDEATPPLQSSNTSPILIALITALLGGFLSLVGVFIRAAIREPTPEAPSITQKPEGSQAPVVTGS